MLGLGWHDDARLTSSLTVKGLLTMRDVRPFLVPVDNFEVAFHRMELDVYVLYYFKTALNLHKSIRSSLLRSSSLFVGGYGAIPGFELVRMFEWFL